MPKETIATRTETDTDRDGGVLETREDRLNVAWGRFDEIDWPDTVQVTIRQEAYEGVYDWRAVPSAQPAHSARELYSMALTRREINALIRVLRRAREQVFGSDV